MTLRRSLALSLLLALVGCDGEMGLDAGDGSNDAGPGAVDGGGVDAGGAGSDAGSDGGPVGDDAGGGPDAGSGGDGGAGLDAGPLDAGLGDAGTRDAGPPSRINELDLLLMVDNSNSMTEEQASLTAELPRLVRVLSSGDFDGDGTLTGPDDFTPFSLRVGVITADMGTGGHAVPTCSRPTFGDDGILRTAGRTDISGCMATYPSFMAFDPAAGGDPSAFARDVACVATAGTGGCGFEQQLEATLKALSPAAATAWTASGYTAPTFFMSTFGHGDGANAGFVRDGSVLTIIPLTDENDCSALDPDLFDPSSVTYGGTDLNLRCFVHPSALHPVMRYIDGLEQLRVSPSRLVYAPIVGIPVDLAPTGGASPDYVRLISPDLTMRDPRMVERRDPAMTTRLAPSCDVPGRGLAFPPTRLVEVAQALEARGAGVTVQSICQDSFRGALTEIIRRTAAAAGP